jgi:hypothetical protein
VVEPARHRLDHDLGLLGLDPHRLGLGKGWRRDAKGE